MCVCVHVCVCVCDASMSPKSMTPVTAFLPPAAPAAAAAAAEEAEERTMLAWRMPFRRESALKRSGGEEDATC